MTTALPPPDLRPLRAVLPSALVALDFDGTLAPISPHPDDARVAAGVAPLLLGLRAAGAAVAVVTGRSVESLLRVSGFDAVPGLVVYGLHGLERWENGRLRAPQTPDGIRALRLSLPAIVAAAHDPDVWIEDKELSLVVHARMAAEPERLISRLRAPVTEAAAAAGLEVHPGKGVLEVVIPGTDKGTALRELIAGGTGQGDGHGDGEATRAVCFAGDDTGDVPAVQAVNAWSARTGRPKLTVAVSPAGPGPLAGLADVTVTDPPALVALLERLIEDDHPSRP